MKKNLLILLTLGLFLVGCAHTPQIAQQSLAVQPAGFSWFHRDGTINWDAQVLPIDTIVVHHSALDPNATWVRISNLQKETLYRPRYESSDPEPYLKGQEPHSGHFRPVGGEWREVFYAYHWLVRPNGKCERLLQDCEVGWQAGNWDVNCRSIAICFAGDFTDGQPTDEALDACATLIAGYMKNFPAIKIENVIGHREVNPKTICPGNGFLGPDGWKQTLINKVHHNVMQSLK
ncbi:MAG: peptidoglycan recognition family protein [Candidatus Pacebacteria bacterium]|nr:peptidoglycan recognition family protein [Candidatus Paceibacterota bacterium]